MLRYVFLALALVIATTANARDPDGRYAQSPLRDWFNTLRNKNMIPCCDTSDGQRVEDVDWEAKEGRYRVRIDGQWYEVPPEAQIDQPNKFGPAIVWPYKEGGQIKIRCFIPGAGS